MNNIVQITNHFTQSTRWKQFLDANPMLQVELTRPCQSTDLVVGEPYVFICFMDDYSFPIIYKVVFRETDPMRCGIDYTFKIEPEGHSLFIKDSELATNVLLYEYTEDVPCK